MVELLYFDGCPSAAAAEALLRRILAEEGRTPRLTKILVRTPEQAAAVRFLGSPTVRVDGLDIEPARTDEPGGALSCRLYRTERGESGVPPEALLRAAVQRLAPAARDTIRRLSGATEQTDEEAST
jgi:hypothetical protein